MNYTKIPHGIRKSIIKKAYERLVVEARLRFDLQNTPVFNTGDKVALPKQRVALWGGWKVYDPAVIKTQPEFATVAKSYIDDGLVWERVFYRKERELDECQTMYQLESFIKKQIEGALYRTYRLDGVTFTWCVPEVFLKPWAASYSI